MSSRAKQAQTTDRTTGAAYRRREQRLIFKYQSGEEIKKGDRVLFHGQPGEIELVASDPKDPEAAWFVEEYGGGVMISEPKVFGRAFLTTTEQEDLVFVARALQKPAI